MNILLKLFLPSIICCTHAEPLLLSGYEFGSRVRVTACSEKGVRCEGAALFAEWVVVLNSCIHAQEIDHIYVQRGIVNCTQERTTPSIGPERGPSVRSVVERFPHPRVPDVDLALLKMGWPYEDVLDYRTLSTNTFNMFIVWMKDIQYHYNEMLDNGIQRQSSPIKMFFVTVLLPAASFIIFFFFIVFFTAPTNTSKIPYKSLNHDKKLSDV